MDPGANILFRAIRGKSEELKGEPDRKISKVMWTCT